MIWAVTGLGLQMGCSHTAPPTRDRPLVFSVNPVGNGDFIGAPHHGSAFTDYNELLWQKVAEAGGRSARVLASWREVERVRGQWDWSNLDREIAQCEKYALEPVCLICNIPAWASPTGQNEHGYPPREEFLPDFDAFITRMAERYRGRIRYYEFWNEQNGFGWHVDEVDGQPRYNRVDEYIPLLHRAYKGIKAVDAETQVAMGGLDDVMGNGYRFVELAYQMARERYHGERCWDAVATHPYNKRGVDVIGPLQGKLDRIRAVMRANGDEGMPLWITEYGWNAYQEDMSTAVQAWGTWGFLEVFIRPENRDILIAQQLCISDFEPVNYGYGLCNLNLRPNPAYHEFQRLARADVPQVRHLRYALVDEQVRIAGELSWWPLPEPMRAFVQVLDEQGRVRATADITSQAFAVDLDNLPAGEPLLAEVRYVKQGEKPQPPMERLTILRPAAGPLADGGFEQIFRAGVPWGWTLEGEAILRSTAALDAKYRAEVADSLMLVVFDTLKTYRFDERLLCPVAAKRGDKFAASCKVRFFSDETAEPVIAVNLQLLNPAESGEPAKGGTTANREWTTVHAEVAAPCDAPTLAVSIRSGRLPSTAGRKRWLLCLDDVKLEPLPANKR